MTFDYKLDGNIYTVEVIKKRNKNTYIKVKDDGVIYVTTNYLATKWYIKRILEENEEFLIKSLNKVKRHMKRDNEFYYLDKKYDIIILASNDIKIEDDKIYVKDEKTLEKWLKCETEKVFMDRLRYNYGLFEEFIPYPKLKIRKMKTRWGVCNKRDNSVTLNSKLIRYSIREIDYVIIHELSHFVHFDHSKDFWDTVGKYMPDYKKAVKVLKE